MGTDDQFTRAIRKTALSALSAAAQLLLLITRRSLCILFSTDFHASMKSVKNKIQVNCNRKNSKIFMNFLNTIANKDNYCYN